MEIENAIEQIRKEVVDRDYEIEPWELRGMAEALPKIIKIITSSPYTNPYKNGRITLEMALKWLEMAEGQNDK